MPDAKEVYADIIDHEHFVHPTRPPLSKASRAAQFSPFAALTGYGDLVREAGRETDQKILLDEDRKNELGRRLTSLLRLPAAPAVTVTFFVSDDKKDGGSYRSVTGTLTDFDAAKNELVFAEGERIALDRITDLTSDVFPESI